MAIANPKQQIIQGEDTFLEIFLVTQGDGKIFPLGDLVAAEAYFPKQDGSKLTLTLAAGGIRLLSGDRGLLRLILDKDETALLKKGDINFELQVDVGTEDESDRSIIQFPGLITVVARYP